MKRLWRRITRAHHTGLDPDHLAAGDPWTRLPWAPPPAAFGPGAAGDFREYLRGDSRVVRSTPEAIADWLLGCRYAEDRHLLDEHDHWLHPTTFELVRAGDCEDFALWAWRRLVDSAFDAEFVVGMAPRDDGIAVRHAWVVYREQGEEWVLDGVHRSVSAILRPRAALADRYVPQVGADAGGRRFAFAGLFRSTWGRRVRLVPHDIEDHPGSRQ